MRKLIIMSTALSAILMSCEKEKDTDWVEIPTITKVTLSQTFSTLEMGDTLKLTATILPDTATNKTIFWSSTNPNVATVTNGVVRAISAGATNIIVTTQDGNKRDTCAITVTFALGKVSFATDSTWTISEKGITQIWSDAVETVNCSDINKISFNGGWPGSGFIVDCRSNPDANQKGNMFSWQAVYELKDELCPYPWRVPTAQDFIDLDIAMGGNGQSRYRDTVNGYSWETQLGWYTNLWGATWRDQNSWVYYWSQSEYNAEHGFYLGISKKGIILQYSGFKFFGFLLRCVR